MYQPRRTLSQMHIIKYTRFMRKKTHLLKKKFKTNRGAPPLSLPLPRGV